MTTTRKRTHAVTPEAIAELRDHILNCTSHVIARQGVDKCSLSAVARTTGHSIGMIQHHFATRDALVLASIEYRSDRAITEWRGIVEDADDPLSALGQLLDFSIEGQETFADAWGFWVQTYAVAPRDPAIRSAIFEALELWRSLFVDAVAHARATGRIDESTDPEVIGGYLVAAVDGLAMQTLNGFHGRTPQSMSQTLRGLAAQLLGIDRSALR